MGFIVVQWENENSVSVVNEKKVVSAVELRRDNRWHTDWYKQGSNGYFWSNYFESLWWVKIAILLLDQNLIKE